MTEVTRRKSNGFGHTYKVGNSWKTVRWYPRGMHFSGLLALMAGRAVKFRL